jgi:hypothetical protein
MSVIKHIFITVRQLLICWCGTFCLTRGPVCRLQLLLVRASTVIHGSESRGTRDHILLSEIRDFPYRRLIRLAVIGWRYSTPPPHRISWIVQSQSHIATDGQSISKSYGAHDQIFITLWHLRCCFCGAPPLTRGQVCLFCMLLTLTSAVFLGSASLGTRNHILLSQIWDFPLRRLLRLAGSLWRYSIPPPYW